MADFQTLDFDSRDLDLGWGHHTANPNRRASLTDLSLHTKFHANRENFLWTDGQTDGHPACL